MADHIIGIISISDYLNCGGCLLFRLKQSILICSTNLLAISIIYLVLVFGFASMPSYFNYRSELFWGRK